MRRLVFGADVICRHCRGTGSLAGKVRRDGSGTLTVYRRRVCPVCGGAGIETARRVTA